MTTPAKLKLLNQRYGPIHDDESDDDVEEKKDANNITGRYIVDDEDDDLEVQKDFNSQVFTEEQLAVKTRADSSLLRATENQSLPPSEAESNTNNNGNGQHGRSDVDDTAEESIFETLLNDAAEFETLLFSIRRPSARSRLIKLIGTMKQLSHKLKWEAEVKETLQRMNQNQNVTTISIQDNPINCSLDTPSNATDSQQQPTNNKRNRTEFENNELSSLSTTPIFADSALTNTSLAHIVNTAKKNTDQNSNTTLITSIPASRPPLLKERDNWVKMHIHGSNLLCPDFPIANSCPLGTNCPRKHIYKPPSNKPNCIPMTRELYHARFRQNASPIDMLGWFSKSDLERAYDLYRKVTLTKESFCDKIKPDELNVSYYASCFICPVDDIIYYSQPFPGDLFVNGNKSSQGIWWYLSVKDARDYVATHVIRHLQERKIVPLEFQPDLRSEEDIKAAKRKTAQIASNMFSKCAFTPSTSTIVKQNMILSSTIPDIVPWNWAEVDYESRCAHFNTPEGCLFGSQCELAHVHYPKSVISDRFPPRDALPSAYYQIFQVNIQDSFFQPTKQKVPSTVFHVKTAVDNLNQIWYTATWKCPYEKILYYAAGGTNGRSNGQGFIMYPSIEEAKSAVCGVVLTAFFGRGFRGPWTQGYIE